MTARRPRARRAERGLSLEQLDAWFDTLDPPARVEGVSMLDGYLTAIVIGPCSIPPDEWFADLFGARGHIATASDTMLKAITAILARFNAISEGLATAPERHAPLFEKTGEGLIHPHPWCIGFLTAMRLRFDRWKPLLDAAGSGDLLLWPILLYHADASGLSLPEAPRGAPRIGDVLQTAYHHIPIVIPAIREYWMPDRVREANSQR